MTPSTDEPRAFLPLHPLEFRILLALLSGPGHGYRIVKEIEAEQPMGTTLYPANLYRRIRNLLEGGLLEESAPPEGEEDVDSRRTYFRLTGLGRRVARAESERLRELLSHARERGLPEST